jgi:hypothetical protein
MSEKESSMKYLHNTGYMDALYFTKYKLRLCCFQTAAVTNNKGEFGRPLERSVNKWIEMAITVTSCCCYQITERMLAIHEGLYRHIIIWRSILQQLEFFSSNKLIKP